jgi:hypothetical protein
MKVIKIILAVIILVIIISFYLPYCNGDGDKYLANKYSIKGMGDFWKWIVIWVIIIGGGIFVYHTFFNHDQSDKHTK